MSDNLKQYLKIDKQRLDEELVQQASLFYEISEKYVEAVAKRDALKEDLAEIDALAEQRIRGMLGDKCTEGKVKSLLALEKVHIDAIEEWLGAKAEADKLQALKEAFHQRSYMLRDLAQLYISNYYSTESVQATPEARYKVARRDR